MSDSIGDFVKQSISELNNSMPEGWDLDHTINFEMTVTSSETIDGKMSIKVFSAGGETKAEAVQKISFSVTNKAKAAEAETSQYAELGKGMTAMLSPFINMDQTANASDNNNPS